MSARAAASLTAGIAALVLCAGASASPRIGVAPFAADDGSPASALAGALARQLDALSEARVVSPDAILLDVSSVADPRASDVRRWAEEYALDELVVGRSRSGSRETLVELRSGHSGAARVEYRVAPDAGVPLDATAGRLARLILADLGEETAPAAAALPQVSAAAPGSEPRAGDSAAADVAVADDEVSLLPGASSDEPIAINSEELEVLPQGGGRRLVFSRNVEVQQGDITLYADRLEAIYPEGASQPDRLFASGHVRVVQGDRRGRCEEATYERAANTIVCRGKAQVTQGCDQVRGESIEFDLGRKRVRVVGAASVVIQPDDAEGCKVAAEVSR